MKNTSVVTRLFSVIVLALPLTLWAEHHEEAAAPPPLNDVWIIVPKRGMEAEFYEAMGKHIAYRAEKEDSRDWSAYNVTIGKNMAPLQIRACCFDWADIDTYQAESDEKGFGDHFNEHVDAFVDHYHHYLDHADWENSHWPDGEGNGPYYGVTTWSLKADRGPQTSQAVDKMSQLAKNEGWATDENNWLWISQIGGADQLSLVSSYDDHADMASPEPNFFEFIVGQLGEEEAGALFDSFNSGMAEVDYTVWVLNENLTPAKDD